LQLEHIPSVGNFLTVRVPQAAQVYQRLLRQGVIVRPVAAYELPDFLRVTIGLEAENGRFLSALRAALHA
jgi:histidinol-phosphate aminotransferase